MRVYTLWIQRRHDPTPELLEAWDEYSADEYPDGWAEAKRKAIAAVDGDFVTKADVVLEVDEEALLAVLAPSATLPATVTQ